MLFYKKKLAPSTPSTNPTPQKSTLDNDATEHCALFQKILQEYRGEFLDITQKGHFITVPSCTSWLTRHLLESLFHKHQIPFTISHNTQVLTYQWADKVAYILFLNDLMKGYSSLVFPKSQALHKHDAVLKKYNASLETIITQLSSIPTLGTGFYLDDPYSFGIKFHFKEAPVEDVQYVLKKTFGLDSTQAASTDRSFIALKIHADTEWSNFPPGHFDTLPSLLTLAKTRGAPSNAKTEYADTVKQILSILTSKPQKNNDNNQKEKPTKTPSQTKIDPDLLLREMEKATHFPYTDPASHAHALTALLCRHYGETSALCDNDGSFITLRGITKPSTLLLFKTFLSHHDIAFTAKHGVIGFRFDRAHNYRALLETIRGGLSTLITPKEPFSLDETLSLQKFTSFLTTLYVQLHALSHCKVGYDAHHLFFSYPVTCAASQHVQQVLLQKYKLKSTSSAEETGYITLTIPAFKRWHRSKADTLSSLPTLFEEARALAQPGTSSPAPLPQSTPLKETPSLAPTIVVILSREEREAREAEEAKKQRKLQKEKKVQQMAHLQAAKEKLTQLVEEQKMVEEQIKNFEKKILQTTKGPKPTLPADLPIKKKALEQKITDVTVQITHLTSTLFPVHNTPTPPPSPQKPHAKPHVETPPLPDLHSMVQLDNGKALLTAKSNDNAGPSAFEALQLEARKIQKCTALLKEAQTAITFIHEEKDTSPDSIKGALIRAVTCLYEAYTYCDAFHPIHSRFNADNLRRFRNHITRLDPSLSYKAIMQLALLLPDDISALREQIFFPLPPKCTLNLACDPKQNDMLYATLKQSIEALQTLENKDAASGYQAISHLATAETCWEILKQQSYTWRFASKHSALQAVNTALPLFRNILLHPGGVDSKDTLVVGSTHAKEIYTLIHNHVKGITMPSSWKNCQKPLKQPLHLPHIPNKACTYIFTTLCALLTKITQTEGNDLQGRLIKKCCHIIKQLHPDEITLYAGAYGMKEPLMHVREGLQKHETKDAYHADIRELAACFQQKAFLVQTVRSSA